MSELMTTTIESYEELRHWARQFAKPAGLNCMFIIGRPGTAKSFTLRTALAEQGELIEGVLSPAHFHERLYAAKDKLIVLDDIDNLFKHREIVNQLKSLCQTEVVKRISWGKQNQTMRKVNIPHTFNTTSRVCVLANTMAKIETNLAAVLDRAFVLHFAPSTKEVHREVGLWFKEPEIYEFIGENLAMAQDASMRLYVKAAELKSHDMDWKDWILSQWTNHKPLALVVKILGDRGLNTAEDRVKKFIELGGGSRDTYYRWQKLCRTIQGAL
jgi:hypothetical protein